MQLLDVSQVPAGQPLRSTLAQQTLGRVAAFGPRPVLGIYRREPSTIFHPGPGVWVKIKLDRRISSLPGFHFGYPFLAHSQVCIHGHSTAQWCRRHVTKGGRSLGLSHVLRAPS